MVLGVPNNRLKCMQGQKALSFSYNMHLFSSLQLRAQQVGGNMLMFDVDVNMKRLGTRFNDSESTLSFERQ